MLVEVVNQRTRQIARAHLNQPEGLAFSSDGQRLITSGTGGTDTLKVWDVESGRDLAALSGAPGFYNRIGFSPDGNTLFAVSNKGTALLWRAPSFEEIAAREQSQAPSP
jgi:WD40 repeat protein